MSAFQLFLRFAISIAIIVAVVMATTTTATRLASVLKRGDPESYAGVGFLIAIIVIMPTMFWLLNLAWPNFFGQ